MVCVTAASHSPLKCVLITALILFSGCLIPLATDTFFSAVSVDAMVVDRTYALPFRCGGNANVEHVQLVEHYYGPITSVSRSVVLPLFFSQGRSVLTTFWSDRLP